MMKKSLWSSNNYKQDNSRWCMQARQNIEIIQILKFKLKKLKLNKKKFMELKL